MNPIRYSQKDAKWKDIPYAVTGENGTIGSSGCGPTCMAMVIASLKNNGHTPKDACAWSLAHGYKLLNQGTAYSYFAAHGKVYGIDVQMVNGSNIYGKSTALATSSHTKALNALKSGDWVIACMGPGVWTSGGHYILAYGIDGSDVLINDPNSSAAKRLRNSITVWQQQVKYYFIVSVPKNTSATASTAAAQKGKSTTMAGAKEKNAAYSKTYATTAELNLRYGPDADKYEVIVAMPKGARFKCYGYLTVAANGVPWLYGVATVNGKSYTGFCSSKYLK